MPSDRSLRILYVTSSFGGGTGKHLSLFLKRAISLHIIPSLYILTRNERNKAFIPSIEKKISVYIPPERKWCHISFPIDSDRVRKLSRPLTFSCQKARRVFGYEPVETLEEGISKEVIWLKLL